MLKTTIAAAVALLGVVSTANAMSFARVATGELCESSMPSVAANRGPCVVIHMTGQIMSGDMAKLGAWLDTLPPSDRVIAFSLDSPGGVLGEALQMADMIARIPAKTELFDNTTCASACFWLFAAGRYREMSSRARLGVHSVSDALGAEMPGGTITVARMAHQFGVPDQIIGKMVATPPDQITWLTIADLKAMPVEVIGPRASR